MFRFGAAAFRTSQCCNAALIAPLGAIAALRVQPGHSSTWLLLCVGAGGAEGFGLHPLLEDQWGSGGAVGASLRGLSPFPISAHSPSLL